MIYSILIIKNRYTKKLNINKYVVDWFKKNTPIEIVTEEISTDFDVTSMKASNSTFSGVIVGKEILPKIRTVVPEGKYNAVVFIYGNDLDGIRVSSCNIMGQDPLYPDTEFIQTFQGNDSGKVINHELFHAFFFKANKLQIGLVDNMDTYTKDGDFDVNGVIDTNREVALIKLAPHWDKICSFRTSVKVPKVYLKRIHFSQKEIIGELRTEDGLWGCDTLELPYLNNQRNISAIPTGEYQVKWTYSLKFPLGSYEIQKVPNRSGIRFHSASFWSDLQGCIALGSLPIDLNGDKQLDLRNSRLITNAFNNYMGKKDFYLTIK